MSYLKPQVSFVLNFAPLFSLMSSKFTQELYVMKMKNDAKFEEELTHRFKIDMRNLTNFDPST